MEKFMDHTKELKVRKPRKKVPSFVQVAEATALTPMQPIVEETIVHPKHDNTVSERVIDHLKGKYVKRQLVYLENNGLLTVSVRKVVLDTFNDFARELKKELGY